MNIDILNDYTKNINNLNYDENYYYFIDLENFFNNNLKSLYDIYYDIYINFNNNNDNIFVEIFLKKYNYEFNNLINYEYVNYYIKKLYNDNERNNNIYLLYYFILCKKLNIFSFFIFNNDIQYNLKNKLPNFLNNISISDKYNTIKCIYYIDDNIINVNKNNYKNILKKYITFKHKLLYSDINNIIIIINNIFLWTISLYFNIELYLYKHYLKLNKKERKSKYKEYIKDVTNNFKELFIYKDIYKTFIKYKYKYRLKNNLYENKLKLMCVEDNYFIINIRTNI